MHLYKKLREKKVILTTTTTNLIVHRGLKVYIYICYPYQNQNNHYNLIPNLNPNLIHDPYSYLNTNIIPNLISN